MDNTAQPRYFAHRVGRAIGTLRRRRGWSQEALAERLGQTAKAIAKLESGRSDLRLSTIVKVARALDVSPGQLLDTEPDGDTGRTVRKRGPLQGLARAGWRRAEPGAADAIPVLDLQPRAGRGRSQVEPLIVAWARPPEGRHPREAGLFLAQVRGDSMEPTLQDGAWCLFSRAFTSTDCLGSLALVRETDVAGLTAWIVKRITAVQWHDDERMSIRLASLNPAYATREVAVDGNSAVAIEAVVREILPSGADAAHGADPRSS